jgi:hypothetical protein
MMIEQEQPARLLVFDEDRRFCEGLRRAARRSGLAVTACYNFSDFWRTLLGQRREIVGVVLSQSLVPPLLKAPLLPRLGDTPVVVTGATLRNAAAAAAQLPLPNATSVAKRAGLPAVLSAVAERRPAEAPLH